MKIGLVLSNTPAYSETFFNSKIKGLIKNGIEVELFVSHSDKSFDLCKVNVSPCIHKGSPISLFLSILVVCFKLLFYLPRVIKFYGLQRSEIIPFRALVKSLYLNSHILTSKNIDWLHFGFATQAIGRELVAKVIGAKMAVSFRGFDINVYTVKHPSCYTLLWKHVDKVHSISKYLLYQAYDLGLSTNVPYQIIKPAVAMETLDLVSNDKQKSEIVQIVTIARLHWIKGIDLLIETAALLKDDGIAFTWNIIGSGDQKSTERYQYHIYEKGLQNYVQLLGKYSHKETLQKLQQADLYVQTSLNEGFCNAVLEAQAIGVLCIASDAGGLPENIIDNETGWLFPKFDASLLALKIKDVLALPEKRKREITDNAMSRVIADFIIEKQQEEFVNFYNI